MEEYDLAMKTKWYTEYSMHAANSKCDFATTKLAFARWRNSAQLLYIYYYEYVGSAI